LFPEGLGSGGGVGLNGSCGKTNEPGSWDGFGESGPESGLSALDLWEDVALRDAPFLLLELEEDFFELPLVRPVFAVEDRNL